MVLLIASVLDEALVDASIFRFHILDHQVTPAKDFMPIRQRLV